MLNRKRHACLLLLLLLGSSLLFAQASDPQTTQIYSTADAGNFKDTTLSYTIREITIEGARVTKDRILLRELSIEKGRAYSLPDLVRRCNKARLQLMNTTLFKEVAVSLQKIQGNEAAVTVKVVERWYIFPIPFAKVVGQPMQQWYKTMNFNQVDYGLRLQHKNVSGLNDLLDLKWSNGFTKELALQYSGLAVDHQLKWFAGFSIAQGKRRTLPYYTENNKRVLFNDGNRFVYSYFQTGANLHYRPAIKTRHSFGVGYFKQSFSDSLGKINARFSNRHNTVTYPEFYYTLQHQNLDFIPYATKGFATHILFQRRGWNSAVNLWHLSTRASAFWPLSKRQFFNLQVTGSLKLPLQQPYTQQGFVGENGLFLQGYENYVIDGVAGGFAKAAFHQGLFNRNFHIRSNRFKRFNNIPVKIYGKTFANAGYIYNTNPGTNFLNNRPLYSGGIGLDFVLFYDVIFKVEYSFNHLGQNGLYLHDRNNL